MTRISFLGNPKQNGKLVKIFQVRGRVSLVLVTGAHWGESSFLAHHCGFCSTSRQSRQTRVTYPVERDERAWERGRVNVFGRDTHMGVAGQT